MKPGDRIVMHIVRTGTVAPARPVVVSEQEAAQMRERIANEGKVLVDWDDGTRSYVSASLLEKMP